MSKICKNCKNEINSDAKYCPICKKKQGGLPKWAIVLIVIFAIIVLAMAFSGDTDDTNTNDNNATNIIGSLTVSLNGKEYFKENIYIKEPKKEKELKWYQKLIKMLFKKEYYD